MGIGSHVWVQFPRFGAWYRGVVSHWYCSLNIAVHILDEVKGADGKVMKDLTAARSRFELEPRDPAKNGFDIPSGGPI
jgi:hypothetical protein